MSTPSDIDLYRRLTAMADELEALAAGGASLVGEVATMTAAQSLRGAAQALYEHALGELDS